MTNEQLLLLIITNYYNSLILATNFSEARRFPSAQDTAGGARVNGNLNLSRAIGDLEYKKCLGHPWLVIYCWLVVWNMAFIFSIYWE